MRKTFPKDGVRKLKDTVHELRGKLNELEKENRFLKKEIEAIMKPKSPKSKLEVPTTPNTHDEWRKDFLRRLKAEVFDKKK
jgi:hypothetical protein